jgi:hypothetical protein
MGLWVSLAGFGAVWPVLGVAGANVMILKPCEIVGRDSVSLRVIILNCILLCSVVGRV